MQRDPQMRQHLLEMQLDQMRLQLDHENQLLQFQLLQNPQTQSAQGHTPGEEQQHNQMQRMGLCDVQAFATNFPSTTMDAFSWATASSSISSPTAPTASPVQAFLHQGDVIIDATMSSASPSTPHARSFSVGPALSSFGGMSAQFADGRRDSGLGMLPTSLTGLFTPLASQPFQPDGHHQASPVRAEPESVSAVGDVQTQTQPQPQPPQRLTFTNLSSTFVVAPSGPRGARRASAASAHAKTASAPAAGVGVVGADGKPRKRIHANKQQLEVLETAFRQCRKPTSKMRAEISKAVGINGRSVQIWFQNRRAREKKTSPAEAAAVAATGPDAADAAPPSTSTSSSSSSSSSSPPSATAATAAGAASKDEECTSRDAAENLLQPDGSSLLPSAILGQRTAAHDRRLSSASTASTDSVLSIVSTSATDSGTATDYGMDGTPNHTFNSASTFAKSGVPCPSPSVSSLGAARSPAVVVTPMSASTPVMHSADSSRRPSLAFPDPISVEASSLIIGSWRRFANLPNDLVAQISLSESNLRWCVMESGYCFRIDIPLSNISEFYLEQASTFSSLSAPVSLPFGVSSASAVALIVNVCSPPLFSKSNSNQTLSPTLNSSSLLSPGSPTTLFTACEDFTESAQASLCSKHILLGTPQAIHSIFVTLSSLLPTAAVSAPRQPTIHLPALTGPAASPNPAAATGRTSQWTTAPSPSFSPVAALARTARSNSVPDALFAASLASRTGLGLVSDPAAMLHRRFSIAAASMFGNGATTTTASAAAASSPAPSSPSTAMTASRDSAVVGLLASPGLSALAPDLPQNNTLSSIWLGPTL